ncbi:PERQ amino acid-rich with GYF domain-containing protein 1-like [Scleropages formosus]|uniref:PERQ amino acid-rich with GYF domain-containing protein 1-like n=1 Tax=Scleropages formosus TaxID=113540 RepID=A0A0P7VRM7_SCLFO|nr:PERQ amino acid-rich with GYF domain-containing protein 1-like [Scleropages formosus]
MPKYKLADYRYGREEMLALYIKDNKVPEEMQDKEFAAILQDEPLQPLALVPLTEEEQRNFSMSVNSVAVLRLMGKGGGAIPAGVTRGRGSTRGGRGRGRGDSGFYQRSIEDAEVGFGRSAREIHRSQSWDDRGERRFEKPARRDGVRVAFEETGAGSRKDYARADSENWRTLREEQEEEDAGTEPAGSWRVAGVRRDDGGPRSAGWREHGGSVDGRRRKFDFDFREHPEGGRRRAGSEGPEEDRDGLPEWCTDEEDGEMGTFDSSGAFLPIKKGSKDAIPEEQRLDFQGLEEEEEENSLTQHRKESGTEKAEEKEPAVTCDREVKSTAPPSPPAISSPPASVAESQSPLIEPDPPQVSQAPSIHPAKANKMPNEEGASAGGPTQLSPGSSSSLPSSPPSSAATDLPPLVGDTEDDEGLKHLQQEAEKMVASLQDSSLDEESFTQTLQDRCNTAAALPLSHEAAMKWFYKDPQGEIQGPFTTLEMSEWFQAGYFSMTLLVKRGCDEGFQPLGDVIKMWGRVPFAPGPSPPPLLVRQPLCPIAAQGPALQQERRDAELRAKREEEERKRREEKRRQQEEQKRREEEELYRRKQCRQQQELILKLLQQTQQQSTQSGSAWSGGPGAALSKPGKAMSVLELQQEAERQLHKQQRVQQQQRDRHGGMSLGSPGVSALGGQWGETAGSLWASGSMESKTGGSGMGLWDEAVKNQASLRNMGLKTSRSSPSLSEPYLLNRRKRTEEEDKLLKLLQGMKPQDGFTTWCEQMLHALNTSPNNSSSSLDVATIVAYLKEVESPYDVLDFIRSYLGDTVEAKEFAKQFLERRAKQKANHQRQQQQDSMRGMNPALQSMFQSAHMGKVGVYDGQSGKMMKKKQSMMLHSDPSILGYSFHSAGDRLSLGEMEMVEEY